MLGVGSRREGVRLHRLDDVEGRRREARADAEVLNRSKEIGLVLAAGAPRVGAPEEKGRNERVPEAGEHHCGDECQQRQGRHRNDFGGRDVRWLGPQDIDQDVCDAIGEGQYLRQAICEGK